MKKIKELFKDHNKVTTMEIKDRGKKPFTFIGSRVKRSGLKMWEFNPNTWGLRQIVEKPTEVKFLETKRFLFIPYNTSVLTKIMDRFDYKGGRAYVQASSAKVVNKKISQYLDAKANQLKNKL